MRVEFQICFPESSPYVTDASNQTGLFFGRDDVLCYSLRRKSKMLENKLLTAFFGDLIKISNNCTNLIRTHNGR